jgi:probable HAF family extracellular repeat protein
MKLASITALLAAVGMNLGLASIAAAQSSYSVLDLGIVSARALNDSGQVAGLMDLPNGTQAFYTGANGVGFTMLSAPTETSVPIPAGIANNGQIVGQYEIVHSTGPIRFEELGFVTGPQGQGITVINSPKGFPYYASVSAINTNGQMSLNTDGGSYLMKTDGTGATALSSFGGTTYSNDINASGQVVGNSYIGSTGITHAFLTGANGVGIQDLGTLGPSNASTVSYASAVNSNGQVVGYSLTDDFQTHAFYTGAQGSGMKDLGTLGGSFSKAIDINDLGQAVGYATLADGATHVFVSSADGQELFDLNAFAGLPPGVDLSQPIAINNAGQILAIDDLGHSYLLTPTAVPEAQTNLLMLLGLGAMGWAVRRRRKMD